PHGVSTLQEMELLVKAGLSPAQALVAGTATSARVMRLDGDRGTISPGKRADIVLIDGKPWDQIADVHKISHVFIDGRLVSGAGAAPMPAANSANRLPAVTVTALIDDFERTDRRSALDTLRLETPDGGHDRTVEITQVVPRDGGGKALALSARMAVKEAPYAGFAVPLTRGSVVPVDVSSFKGVRFDLKGDGDYRIRINGLDGAWEAAVTGAEQWASKEIPFSAFKPVARGRQGGASWTGQDVTQVELGGTRPGGQRMWLQVDNISFY
ncbi:CIA30 family protein, partial [Polymorphobacter multimanifer]